jgi:hypothetical protein
MSKPIVSSSSPSPPSPTPSSSSSSSSFGSDDESDGEYRQRYQREPPGFDFDNRTKRPGGIRDVFVGSKSDEAILELAELLGWTQELMELMSNGVAELSSTTSEADVDKDELGMEDKLAALSIINVVREKENDDVVQENDEHEKKDVEKL